MPPVRFWRLLRSNAFFRRLKNLSQKHCTTKKKKVNNIMKSSLNVNNIACLLAKKLRYRTFLILSCDIEVYQSKLRYGAWLNDVTI